MFSLDIRPSNEHMCVPQSSKVVNCINPIYSNETEKYINGKDMSILLPKQSICARDSTNGSVLCVNDLETFADIHLNKQYDRPSILNTAVTSTTPLTSTTPNPNTFTALNNNNSTFSLKPNDFNVKPHEETNMTYSSIDRPLTALNGKNIIDDTIDECKYDRGVLIEPHYLDKDSNCTNGTQKGVIYGPKESSRCILPNKEKEYVCALSCRYDKEIKNAEEKYCRSWKKIESRDLDMTDDNLNLINSNQMSVPISDEIVTVLKKSGRRNMNIIESDCMNSTCNVDKCTIPKDKTTVLEIEKNGIKTYWKHDPPKPDLPTLTRITDYCNTSDTNRVSCREKCKSLS